MVCNGCALATYKMGIGNKCEFCRTPQPEDDAEILKLVQARVEKKDPAAIEHLGGHYAKGKLGLEQDAARAVELWTEAAELGSAYACYKLGVAYVNGNGVGQDSERGVRFSEKAAMLGQPDARHHLGCYEYNLGNYDRGVRHFMISAKMGYAPSLELIKLLSQIGHATKLQYAEALKGYRDSVEEMKSPEREEAKTHPAFNRSE